MKKSIYVVLETFGVEYDVSNTYTVKAFSSESKAENYMKEIQDIRGNEFIEKGYDYYYSYVEEIELED